MIEQDAADIDAADEEDSGAFAPDDGAEVYWAAKPAEEVIEELQKKERSYFDFIARRGFGEAWLGAYCAYYGIDPDSLQWESHSIGTDGEQGELLRFRINEFRSYVRQSMTMAIGQRPAFEAVAVNDKYETLASIENSDTAINYIYWSKYGERKERRTVESGDLFGSGITWCNFDVDGGEEIDTPLQLPPEAGGGPSPRMTKQRTGEMIIKSKKPWEWFCEPTLEDFDAHLWRCVRDDLTSKWEIAARYPELRERILAATNSDEFAIEAWFGFDAEQVNSDLLVPKHWYHAKTRALPKGRYIVYVGSVVLYDGPLPISVLPFVDYCPAEFIGTALGYADSWDMIPLNQMLDQVASDVATNVANLGRATMVAEEGIDIDVQSIADGMRVLVVPPGAAPPTYLQPPPLGEGAQFICNLLNEKFASISGLNPTARGQSTTNVTSGEMAALFHSIAIEVNSAKQMAVDSHRERTANLMLMIAKQYMRHPMLLTITGADGRKYSREVEPGAFKNVQEVVIKTASPMTRSQAGKLQKLQIMLGIPGAVETPEQVDEMLVSGQLKPVYKAVRAKTLRIAWENEQLRKGPPVQEKPDELAPPNRDGTPATYECTPTVPVLEVDPHHLHVPEHIAELSDPSVLNNPTALRAILAHTYEHFRVRKNMDPALAAFLKLPPLPLPSPMAGLMPGDEETDGSQEALDDGGEHPPWHAQEDAEWRAKQGPEAPPRPRDSTGVPLPNAAKPPAGAQTQRSTP